MRSIVFEVEPDVRIVSNDDWAQLPSQGINHIVDPMVFRTAEVFLAGPVGDRSKDEATWTTIAENLSELLAFFDLVVYADRLPMIDYDITFDPGDGFEARSLYEHCGSYIGRDSPLVYVEVGFTAYQDARLFAVEELQTHGPIDPALGASIEAEMTSFDHKWRPDLSDLEAVVQPPGVEPGRDVDERIPYNAAAFLFGGTLFGVYANYAEAAHVLQNKRARLLGAAALDATAARYVDQPALFEALERIYNKEKDAHVGISDALPPVLPYLLRRRGAWSGSSRPAPSSVSLVNDALELRASALGEDFRDWREQIANDFKNGVGVASRTQRQLKELARRLEARTELYVPPAPVPGGVADPTSELVTYAAKAMPWERLWLWSMANVPGRGHMKLIHRLQFAAQSHRSIDNYYLYLTDVLKRCWLSTA